VAIGPRYVLTARHNTGGGVVDEDYLITKGTTEYTSVNVKRFPEQGDYQFDLAVVEVDQDFPAGQYYPVYGGSGELDMAVTMVGYGQRGEYVPGVGWNPVSWTYGTRREGASVVQEVLDQTIHLSFDGGENPAYCIAAPGDSGGAVFAAISDQTTLIGVPTFTSGYPAQPGYITTAQRVSAAQLWIMGFSTGFTFCHHIRVTEGSAPSISEKSMYRSDDLRQAIDSFPPVVPGSPSLRVEFDGCAPQLRDDVGSLSFTIESRCTAFPLSGVEQRVQLFNYQSGLWETVSTTTPTSTDTVVTVNPTGDPKRFVKEGGREEVLARVAWYQICVPITLSWKVEMDQVKWTITHS
jgi:hypothetical protein